MNVLILGGDGYLGWPTAMHLASSGYKVTVVDNYMRRDLMRDLGLNPLFPVPDLRQRVHIWNGEGRNEISVKIGDLNDWDFIADVFQSSEFDAIVHYAEQPSAPYSMMNRDTAKHTLMNNLGVTFNIIQAMHTFAPDAHLVKLGTMGEYGTPNIDIEEGWLDITHNDRKQKFLYPRQAGSLYHTTKIMDTDLLWFYVRVWGLKVTDLMQGPVYGMMTKESSSDDQLLPFFCYDEMFGTVLNRFVVQAVGKYPLTVYGNGGQTRGYLNILDTLNCVKLSIENAAESGELRIYNQFTETFSVNDLALKIQNIGSQFGINVDIQTVENPREELEEHYYNPVHKKLADIGLEPSYLTDETLGGLFELVLQHQDKIDKSIIFNGVKWK